MAMEVLRLVAGNPYGGDRYDAYDLKPTSVSPAFLEKIQEEMALWEFRFERTDVYDHDDYGKDESTCWETPMAVSIDLVNPVVWNDRLVAVKRGNALYFIPGEKSVGDTVTKLYGESTSRSERYAIIRCSIAHASATTRPVYYEKMDGNLQHTVIGAAPSLEEIVLPYGVVAIKSCAFGKCKRLVSLSIPASVTQIEEGTLSGCVNLKAITVEEGNPVFESVENCLINKEKKLLIACASGAVIPANYGMTRIGWGVFSEANAQCIAIPEGVTAIDEAAFYSAKLTSVILPKSLEKIGSFAFAYCQGLREVYYGGSEADWQAISISAQNEALKSATRYYYRGEKPVEKGLFWHYDENGLACPWED